MVFKRKILTPKVDLHSHIIPNIDDGAQSIEQSLAMLDKLIRLGYKKCITTPHIHPKYPNTAQKIKEEYEKLKTELVNQGIPIALEVAAEYYVDELFLNKLRTDSKLLTVGDELLLVECSFINKPFNFQPIMLELMHKGYKPVLAHPERYQFLEENIDWLEALKHIGVLFQVTLGSIGGGYGKKPEQISKTLLKNRMVDFLGSDFHRISHTPFLKRGLAYSAVQKGIKEGYFKNFELL